MLHIWISLVAVFTVQEVASTAAVLLLAKEAGLNLWLIHGLFFLTTIGETLIGYAAAKVAKERFPDSRFAKWTKHLAERWNVKRTKGTNVFLVVFGFLNFTWSTAFLAVWLDIPFWPIIVWTTIGDAIWYAMEWAIALGVSAVSPNFITALVSIISIGAVLTLVLLFFQKRTTDSFNK